MKPRIKYSCLHMRALSHTHNPSLYYFIIIWVNNDDYIGSQFFLNIDIYGQTFTFSMQSSKNANPVSLSLTKLHSSIKRIKICVLDKRV